MKKVLFIDRDGTLVIEPPVDYQLDSLEKLEFYPKVMRNLGFVRSKLDFEFVMVTNMLKPKSAGGEAACEGLEDVCALATKDWDKVAEFLFAGERKAEVRRITKETNIYVAVNLDGNSRCDIHTGLGFFDHMLEQIGKHGGMDLTIHVKGDLEVDEHHTIEDTALALGDCLYRALGNKRGIERYGYALPMDDCLCQVCLDFGGRPWLVWDAEFKREKRRDAYGNVPALL